MESLHTLLSAPPLWLPLSMGAAGVGCILFGGALRARRHRLVQKAGSCCFALGLGLMSLGVFCLAGRLTA